MYIIFKLTLHVCKIIKKIKLNKKTQEKSIFKMKIIIIVEF